MTTNSNPRFIEALEWSRRGFAVIPLYERQENGTCSCFLGDHCVLPPFHAREFPVEVVPAGEITITQWWTESPNALIGIKTGGPSGVVALELDNGVDVRRLAEFKDLPTGFPVNSSYKSIYFFRSKKTIASKDCIAAVAGAQLHGEGSFLATPDLSQLPADFGLDSLPDLPNWLEALANPRKFENESAQDFPANVFPKPIERLIVENSVSHSCSTAMLGAPVLAVIAAAIGSSHYLKLANGSEEFASIFIAVVAPPGSGKTPALKLAQKPMTNAQRRLDDDRKLEKEKCEQDSRQYTIAHARWRESLRRYSRDEGPFPGDEPHLPTEPILRQLYTTDSTIAALAVVLKNNPFGILCAEDELNRWLNSLGRKSDRAQWSSLWNSQQIIVNRKGEKNPIVVDRPVVSVVGNLTPDMLDQIQGSHKRVDGFIDRFLFATPSFQHQQSIGQKAVHPATEAHYEEIFQKLLALRQGPNNRADADPTELRFTDLASKAYCNWTAENAAEIYGLAMKSVLRGMFVKLKSYWRVLL